jgi:lysyl-tRNA synthetase class 2
MSVWQPSACFNALQKRAAMLAAVRAFFAERKVLEVDVPVLARATVSDPNIESFRVSSPVNPTQQYYLMSSPEFFMKRLLAAGSGAIYSLGHAFRAEENGSRHNIEFTLLEWYRPNWCLAQLMTEVRELVALFVGIPVRYSSYRQLFLDFVGIDPHTASLSELQQIAQQRCAPAFDSEERSVWLDLLFSHLVEPQLQGAVFVDEFPAAQAALAQTTINAHGHAVAARFELYLDGIEIANAYQEEQNAGVLESRFMADLHLRTQRGQTVPPKDEKLLAAIRAGLPACAGVALGFDRLLMLACHKSHIAETMAFAAD